jgi:phosphoserine phosphatase
VSDLNPETRAALAEIRLFFQEDLSDLKAELSEKIGEVRTEVALLKQAQDQLVRAPRASGAAAGAATGGGVVAVVAILKLLGIDLGQ